MDSHQKKKVSKLMSLALRHDPSRLNLQLNTEGWTSTEGLLRGLKQHFPELDMELLREIVATNDKQRFSFSGDQSCIRANQGHSIAVDLNLSPVAPPEQLYHGTVERFVSAIRKNGLQKMSRQYLHLSADLPTATAVGSRKGNPVILIIQSRKMHGDGFDFFLSENGVWLTDHVPADYILEESIAED